MPPPLVYVDTSEIREGKLEELKAAMTELTAFVDAHVPQLLLYGFYLDEGQTHMTVVALHRDSPSLGFHMDVAGTEFRRFADLIDLQTIEIYGAVGDDVLERLHRKARLLGAGTVTTHDLHAGFARIEHVRPATPGPPASPVR